MDLSPGADKLLPPRSSRPRRIGTGATSGEVRQLLGMHADLELGVFFAPRFSDWSAQGGSMICQRTLHTGICFLFLAALPVSSQEGTRATVDGEGTAHLPQGGGSVLGPCESRSACSIHELHPDPGEPRKSDRGREDAASAGRNADSGAAADRRQAGDGNPVGSA